MLEKVNDLFIECVVTRLESLGYRLKIGDASLIKFETLLAFEFVKTEANIDDIPSKLYLTAVNFTAINFLASRKKSGNLEGFNFEPVLQQMKEGDTSMTFNVGDSAEDKFDAMVANTRDEFRHQLVSVRRMVW